MYHGILLNVILLYFILQNVAVHKILSKNKKEKLQRLSNQPISLKLAANNACFAVRVLSFKTEGC
jgi:hypothetical protein